MTWLTLTLALALGIPACSTPSRSGRGGPPPLSPAEGYRHDYRGMTLTYDEELGFYTVDGLGDHYFHDWSLYRLFQDSWYKAPHVIGPWEPAASPSVPTTP